MFFFFWLCFTTIVRLITVIKKYFQELLCLNNTPNKVQNNQEPESVEEKEEKRELTFVTLIQANKREKICKKTGEDTNI